MPIKMTCPSCGKMLSAPDSAVGKKAKCPSCGEIMIVPESAGGLEQEYPLAPEPAAPQPLAGPSGNWIDQMQDAAPGATVSGPGGEQRRPCPVCGEMIVAGAAKCRFCDAVFDPYLRQQAAKKRASAADANMTGGDWVFAIICGFACIVAIVYICQGKPKGWKMLGVCIVAEIIKDVIYFSMQK